MSYELTENERHLIDEYIVYRFINEEYYPIKITKRLNFKSLNFCETFDKQGNLIGCKNAGCESDKKHVECNVWNYEAKDIIQSIVVLRSDGFDYGVEELNEEESVEVLNEYLNQFNIKIFVIDKTKYKYNFVTKTWKTDPWTAHAQLIQ